MPERRSRDDRRQGRDLQARDLHGRDRLAFLLAFVPWLVDHDRVPVAEAAAHFDVSPDQIRQAVRLIAVSGVPGASAAYLDGDLFDIDWDAFEENDEIVITHLVALEAAPRLSAREAAALIAGLQYLSALPENEDRSVLSGLLGKLSRSVSAAPSPLAVRQSGTEALLVPIRQAVARGMQLELQYQSAQGRQETRLVDPLRVDSVDEHWYLRGWCHLRGAMRTFRLDRIVAATVTESPIAHRPDEMRPPDVLFQPSSEDPAVLLEFAAAALPLLSDYLEDGSPVPAGDGRLRAVLRVPHYHGLKRLVAGLPGLVTVVAPEEARRAVSEWASAGAARYSR